LLQVSRIDHGNRSLEDATLVVELVNRKMPLTVCPLSNHKLKVVKKMANHPLAEMLETGLMVTVNSDDPAYFGGYINDNYRVVSHALHLTREQITTLAKNSFEASFLGREEKIRLIQSVDNYYLESSQVARI
ncbi:MAG: adenosine deaminase, partial [Phycisphaerae bacterium]|nr:adenosine deaminase [Saprospiraceae bacterium]